MIKISFDSKISAPAEALQAAVPLAVPVYETQGLGTSGKALDAQLDNMLQNHLNAVHFKGKLGNSHLAVLPHPANFVILLGGGARINGQERLEESQARDIGAALCHILRKTENPKARLVSNLPTESLAAIAFGAVLASYQFDKYLTKEKKFHPQEIIISGKHAEAAKTLFSQSYLPLAQGVFLTRDLVSEPANSLTPAVFAETCRELGKDGLDVDVLDEAAMRDLGMGALLGVAAGSDNPPYLVTMRWQGGTDKQKPIAIVGKGVTFDTGGISLKPSGGMEEMKWDMGGAGVVTGLMCALARRKARVNAVGVVALVENMPSGKAMRPGDVITSLSGQTIEVLNTDAEGRLILADALWYAQEQFAPEIVIDLATLTGAMIITLGHEYAGLFSNDDALAGALFDIGQKTGEKLWRLPLDGAYDKMLLSPIADMKNIGGRPAGSITAAQFLQRFIKPNVKWAHLDIAGMAWFNKPKPTIPKGATGFAVQLLDRYLQQFEADG